MVYLTGAYRRSQVSQLVARGFGVMLQPGSYAPEAMETLGFPAWAADNGCFAQGDRFKLEKFYAWLKRVPRSRLLFATAPDVFLDPLATLERSRPVLRELRAQGYQTALVAQNHSELYEIPWDEFDCLFLGGDTAKRRGKWVHMGRVNSHRRLRYAATIGCDSADGTVLRFRNREAEGLATISWWFDQGILPL